MKSPFHIPFLSTLHATDVSGNLPADTAYPLDFSIAKQYNFDEGRVLKQEFDAYAVVVEIYELDFKDRYAVDFDILENSLTLYFQFQQNISFLTEHTAPIKEVKEETYYAALNKPGSYQIQYTKGKTSLMLASIDLVWGEWLFADLPLLKNLLQGFSLEGNKQHDYLLPCKIGKKVAALLKSFPTKENKLQGELALLVQAAVVNVLKIYEQELEDKLATAWYQAKAYIDTNFRESDINFNQFAVDHYMEIRAFNYNFRKEFGLLPYDYWISLKMQEARRLLRLRDGRTITAIANLVGCSVVNFSGQYKKFFGCLPSEEL